MEDNDENLEDVIRKSKDAGADFLLFSPGLTLRDLQQEFFTRKLKGSKYKDKVKPLLELYKGQIYPPEDYVRKLHLKLLEFCEKYNLAVRIKRWIPNDYRKWNYKISELFLNKVYMDMVKAGKSNNAMMWAGLNLNNFEESILDVYKRGELSKMKNFTKTIVEFIKPYIEKNKELEQKTGLVKFL